MINLVIKLDFAELGCSSSLLQLARLVVYAAHDCCCSAFSVLSVIARVRHFSCGCMGLGSLAFGPPFALDLGSFFALAQKRL